MSYPEAIETDRLALRRWAPDDAYAMEAIWREPEVWSALQPHTPFDPDKWHSKLERHLRHWEDHGFGLWTACPRDNPQPMGWIGASHPTFIPELAGEVEIGWTLRPSLWRRGLATEGATAAVDAAFGELVPERVISIIHPTNLRSIAVAARLGMHHSRDVLHPELDECLRVYALSRSAWSASSSRGASAQSTSSR